MPLSVLQPYNIPRMPSRPQRPLPPQREPGPWDRFAESAGQGLGESIQKQISDKLESSALERALGNVNPNQSVLERHKVLANASPQAREYFNENIAPQLEKEQEHALKSRKAEQQTRADQAYNDILSGNLTGVGTENAPTSEIKKPENMAAENPAPSARPKKIDIKKTPQWRLLTPKQQQDYIKNEQEQQKYDDTQSKEFYNKTQSDLGSYNKERVTLTKMKQLSNSGKLSSPYTAKLAEKLDAPFLLSDESQEMQKLANNYLENLKGTFGSQMSQGEVEIFLRGIPSLMQTEGGRKRVIKNLEQMNDMRKVQADISKEIIQENGGHRPADLEEKTRERMQPYWDDLIEQINRDVEQKVRVYDKNGQLGDIPASRLEMAEKMGYKRAE